MGPTELERIGAVFACWLDEACNARLVSVSRILEAKLELE